MGTPDLYPSPSSTWPKVALNKELPPPLCRACRPTPRRHFATHNLLEEACASGKAGGSFAVQPACGTHTPAVHQGARSALPVPRAVALDWRHGVGRRSRTTRTPNGVPSAGNRTNHDSPLPAFGARLRQSGGGKHRHAPRQKINPERYATRGASRSQWLVGQVSEGAGRVRTRLMRVK